MCIITASLVCLRCWQCDWQKNKDSVVFTRIITYLCTLFYQRSFVRLQVGFVCARGLCKTGILSHSVGRSRGSILTGSWRWDAIIVDHPSQFQPVLWLIETQREWMIYNYFCTVNTLFLDCNHRTVRSGQSVVVKSHPFKCHGGLPVRLNSDWDKDNWTAHATGRVTVTYLI